MKVSSYNEWDPLREVIIGLAQDVPGTESMLPDFEPIFDAANIARCGRDLFYLVSNSGRLRHGRMMKGGFHCVTLDTHRTGSLEDYFH